MGTSKKTHIFIYRLLIFPSKQKPNNNNLNPLELLIKSNKHNTKPCLHLIHKKRSQTISKYYKANQHGPKLDFELEL
jgi:hypothetical protein